MSLRSVHDRIWQADAKFVGLSSLPGSRGERGKFLFLYLNLSPLKNAAGAFEIPIATIVIHTSITAGGVLAGLRDLDEAKMIRWYEEESVVWIPSAFIRYDSRSPNIVKSAFRDLDFLPAKIRGEVLGYWAGEGVVPPEGFGKGFGRVRKGSGTPCGGGRGRGSGEEGEGDSEGGNGTVPIEVRIREWIKDWNGLAERLGLPGVRPPLSKKRAGALGERIREMDEREETWEDVWKKIEESPFLRGDNPRGWKVGIKFLVKPDGPGDILSGMFAKRGKGGAVRGPQRFFKNGPEGASRKGKA